jgi:phenylalanyl-tRNA synthetase alpha chain
MTVKGELAKIREEGLRELREAQTPEAVESARIKYLGRKGIVSERFSKLGKLDPAERAEVGKGLNQLKVELSTALDEAGKRVKGKGEKPRERVDLTIPGKRPARGRYHPITLVQEEMIEIFQGLGFEVVEGPEVEVEFYNFDGLNIPKEHPAREPRDNFYITEDLLLRTQTSPVQIRAMEKREPPVRLISPGKVYRPDTVDSTHHYMFTQIEGLMVERGVSFADLKGVLELFAKGMFGKDVKTRFIPSYFPFTEPSAEMDIGCTFCAGKECEVCGRTGWIELLGCGMVHPNVLKGVGYDYEEFTGWAFGVGIERVAMRKYGINDIRLLTENDVRFLGQFWK